MSARPVHIPQEKGSMKLTRIWGASVSIDYATRWVKVHIMQNISGVSTIEAREAFERDCMTRNVLPKHYLADNGQFS